MKSFPFGFAHVSVCIAVWACGHVCVCVCVVYARATNVSLIESIIYVSLRLIWLWFDGCELGLDQLTHHTNGWSTQHSRCPWATWHKHLCVCASSPARCCAVAKFANGRDVMRVHSVRCKHTHHHHHHSLKNKTKTKRTLQNPINKNKCQMRNSACASTTEIFNLNTFDMICVVVSSSCLAVCRLSGRSIGRSVVERLLWIYCSV